MKKLNSHLQKLNIKAIMLKDLSTVLFAFGFWFLTCHSAFSQTCTYDALKFDGSNWVEIPDHPSLSPCSTCPFTVELWVYRESGNWLQHILGRRSGCDGSGNFYQMVFDPYLNFGNTGLGSAYTGIDLPLFQWHHLAATYDGTLFRFYYDGVFIAAGAGTIGDGGAATLKLGGSGDCYGQFFGGKMDNVRIWNVARTQQEIQADMFGSITGTEQGLAGAWDFDEEGGSIAHDLSPNHNDGILINNPAWVTPAVEINCNGIDDDCDGLTDPETCNGLDDNCNGLVDEGVLTTWCTDLDLDGWIGRTTVESCSPPYGWDAFECPNDPTRDCNDFDSYVIDCSGEICNGIDDNGNGLIDDEDPGLIGAMIWYADEDGDGWGDPDNFIISCTQPLNYLPWPNNLDCDDTNANIYPGSTEVCDGQDNNCDGIVDEGFPDTDFDGIPDCGCPGDDSDCDGIADDCDLCPGGDDSVDNNQDGIADCSQLLNYNDYSPDWQCDNNKIYVCHNDNNPHTICIDANSLLPAHYDHGDQIGPCTSCAQDLNMPGNPVAAIAAATAPVIAERDDQDGISAEKEEREVILLPNPSTENIRIHYDGEIHEIRLVSAQGVQMHAFETDADLHELSLEQMSPGLYTLMIRSGEEWITKRFVKL